MTVDFAYSLTKYASNKNQQGFVSPADFNVIINTAQFSFLDYLLGEFQQYTPGRPVARVELGNNQIIKQRLSPLINLPATVTVSGSGHSTYPSDFQQVDAMYTSDMKRIRYVQQDSLYSYLESVIDPVATNPVYLIDAFGFQLYPITLGIIKLSYVKTPPTIVWASTPDPNGRPIYDPINSVDPVWFDTDMLEIIARALRLVGVNLQNNVLSQYANEIKNTGQ